MRREVKYWTSAERRVDVMAAYGCVCGVPAEWNRMRLGTYMTYVYVESGNMAQGRRRYGIEVKYKTVGPPPALQPLPHTAIP